MTPEEKVQKIVSLKRYEQPPEGYFEEFLEEFYLRQRDQMLKQSSFKLFGERVSTWFQELHFGKWLIGAGLAYGIATVIFLTRGEKVKQSQPNLPTAPVSSPGRVVVPQNANPAVDLARERRYQEALRRKELEKNQQKEPR